MQNKKFCDFVDKQTGYKTKCMLTFPLIAEKECIGVVMALNKIGADAFSAEDEKVRMCSSKNRDVFNEKIKAPVLFLLSVRFSYTTCHKTQL